MSYPNYVYSIFAFTGFLFCCIPFPWHLQAWNTGTCLYMAWAGLACLNQFINSVVWTHDAINYAPVWCDISARFMVGVSVAIPACSLCINRRLYHIASVRSVTVTKAEKRRGIMVDLAIGLGLPIVEMILQYIPQGHRFNIYQEIGCFPFTYNTPVGIALVSVPPVAIGCVSAVYSILSIRAFSKTRAQFKQILSATSNINTNRYFRLMCLAGIEALFTVPLGIYAIYLNSTAGVISPWRGWADTHSGFSRVDQIPSILWRSDPLIERSLELTRWFVVLCAFIFFGFFGFAEEARKNYRSVVQSVAKHVGVSTGSFSSSFSATKSKSSGLTSTSKGATLPVFIQRHTLRKHDSLDSFSDVSVSYIETPSMNEKDKPFAPDMSFGAISLADAGGTLADYHDGPYSPTPSSGASSVSSLSSPVEKSPEAPPTAVTRPDSFIEISSVRHLEAGERAENISFPEPALNISTVPRHAIDAPSAVHRDSLDIV